jgi:hypothetical protein
MIGGGAFDRSASGQKTHRSSGLIAQSLMTKGALRLVFVKIIKKTVFLNEF